MGITEMTYPPQELIKAGEVGRRLGISRGAAGKLLATELAGPAYRLPGADSPEALMAAPETVDRLAAVEFLDGHPAAIVVRVQAARPALDDPTRDYYGYAGRGGSDANARGVASWWYVAEPVRWVGLPLVATVSGFVVVCGTIRDYRTRDDGKVGFTIERTEDVDAAFRGRRMETTGGGNTVFLDERPATRS